MSRQFNDTKIKKTNKFKKVLKWFGISILLILAVLIALPFIFKDKLIEVVKTEVNNSVNATIEWGDFDLTLFSSFPDFKFDIQDVSVTGINEFEGVNLAKIKNTSIDLDLMSVINGGKIKIKSIEINEPDLNFIINKDSLANYDIAKGIEEETSEIESTEATTYEIGLKNLVITNAHINYQDAIAQMSSEVKGMNLELSGDFTQDVFDAKTKTTIKELTFTDGLVSYLNKTNVDLVANVLIDKFTKYTLQENNLKLNELEVGFDGWIEMLDEKMDMNLTFNSKRTDFKSILSLVPAVYLTDFKDIKTKGNLALNGNMKGTLEGENYPEFNLNMAIDNGYFKYPDLPNSADNINIKTNISHSQGDLDKMKIDISKFHLELADNPIDGNLKMSTPMSDPFIQSNIKADIDLDKMKTVIPMGEKEKLNGSIHADLNLAGKMSSVTNEQYQDFKAEGELTVKEMLYVSADLPYDVNVNNMIMDFSPQHVDLKDLDTKIGQSDIKAKGKIVNIFPYMFNNEVLKGNVSITSNKLDLDDLMGPESETDETAIAEADSSYGVIAVPAFYDLSMTTDIKELIYDGLTISNVKGKVAVKDQIADLSNVSMDMLEGNVLLNGSYNTQKENPVVNFDYKVKNVDIEKTAAYFSSFETIAPIAKYCKGKISTNLNVSSMLDQNMSPIYNTINGAGGLMSNDLVVSGIKSLKKIADILKMDQLSSQKLNNLKMAFQFKNGRAEVNPFNIKLAGMATEIKGSTGFDQTVDYKLKMQVPKEKLGNKANEIAAGILGKINSKGASLNLPAIIPVNFAIGGTVTKPIIKSDLGDQAKNMVTDLKNKVVDTVKQTVNLGIDKIMDEAKSQAQKLRNEAKVQADKLRAEGDKLTRQAKEKADEIALKAKQKADEEAEKLSNKGANPFEKIANKKVAELTKKKVYKEIEEAKQKAYEKAEIPSNEADKNATKVEEEAKKQADKIIESAQNRANSMKQ